MYYIPVVVFLLGGLYGHLTLPSFRDPAIVRRPESQLWSLFRFLDDSEWTELGRVARRRYVRHWLVGVGLAIATLLIVRSFDPAR